MKECPVCLRSGGIDFHVKEMMFGTKKTFPYRECSSCGTLYMVAEGSGDIARTYYSEQYYSFNDRAPKQFFVRRFLKAKRVESIMWRETFLGAFLSKRRPMVLPTWLLRSRLSSFNDKILDVGCGSGGLLRYMENVGFRSLHGIDPFLPGDIAEGTLRISRKTIHDTDGRYDCIMFHHSLEHMIDPAESLSKAKSLLSYDDAIIIVRIPVKDSYAWREYKTNWVQIDSPRHQVIFTKDSMGSLCCRVGLEVLEVFCDSTEFQFWGSEQYKRGISLNSEISYSKNPSASVFSDSQIREFARRADELNCESDGDQAVFVLRRAR